MIPPHPFPSFPYQTSHLSCCPGLCFWLKSCFQKALSWTLLTSGGKPLWWTMENTHLFPSTSEKETSTHNTNKKKQLHGTKTGAKHKCQRQLLSVNKYSMQDKASPLSHWLEFFCDECIRCSACLPGRQGWQECLHLCNCISWVHNYPTHPRHSKGWFVGVGFFLFIEEKLVSRWNIFFSIPNLGL